MVKNSKYFFNPDTLQYEHIYANRRAKFKKRMKYTGIVLLFALAANIIHFAFLKTPKEIILEQDREQLKERYVILDNEISALKQNLTDIQQMDDKVYRPIVGIDPLSDVIRMAGYGGTFQYEELKGSEYSSLLIEANKQVDNLAKQIYIQSKSYDEIVTELKEKDKYLSCRPAIPPISPADFGRVSDYYGWRKDPFTHKPAIHYGIDLTGPSGANVNTTGDGVVSRAKRSLFGYGLYVEVDHGYGYKTRYAHLKKILVKQGQKVKRGEVVGLMGNTGRSTGTHLHYEIRVNNKPVNPVYYFDFDITAEEYDYMLDILASRQ